AISAQRKEQAAKEQAIAAQAMEHIATDKALAAQEEEKRAKYEALSALSKALEESAILKQQQAAQNGDKPAASEPVPK
ncbi:MAG: hypothetical protein ACK6AT_17235, partial [Planctomycetota bacterium]